MYELTPLNILRAGFDDMHKLLDQASDLSAEQLNFQPGEGVTPFFSLWHYVRTEDNVTNFVLQDRKPTVWIEAGYNEKFGLDKIAQGTGMSTEDAHAMRLPAMADWMVYQQAVWQSTDDYLANISEADLDQVRVLRPFGELSAAQALSRSCLTHGHTHFGEICIMRGLQGLPSTMA